jgi:hypothetical protein
MYRCNQCKQEIAQSIVVHIRDPERTEPNGINVNFCCWECAAQWFNKEAGEILMPDLDSDFFGSDGPWQKWPD